MKVLTVCVVKKHTVTISLIHRNDYIELNRENFTSSAPNFGVASKHPGE